MEKLGFNLNFYYLDHDGMEKMLASEEGGKLLELARNISVCLHEDWKSNLIREKGTEYQHFRPVKDAQFAEEVLAHQEEYLQQMSEDGKPLYRIVEKENNGEKSYEVQFDLIRVPFENLTKKWQEANLEAAKFALCLVKTAVEKGDLNVTEGPLFENFERMAADIHLEWIYREGEWAAPELQVPYPILKVDTDGYNQKDKDRAHVMATTTELTMQPNILARNRSIVIRAIQELFKDNAIDSGLNPQIMENLLGIQPFIDESNNRDYQIYLQIKSVVMDKAAKLLKGKKELSFDDLESLAAAYYEVWKQSVKFSYQLPEGLDVPYDKVSVDDVRVNHKNIARGEVKLILAEMVEKLMLEPEIAESVKGINDSATPLGKRIAAKNDSDYADYLVLKQKAQN